MTHRTNISFKLDHHVSISIYIDLCIYLSTILLGDVINCTVRLGGSNQILVQKRIGTLRSDNSNRNENIINKAISLISKTTTLHVLHTILVHFFAIFPRR